MSAINWIVSPAIVGFYKVINTSSPMLHSRIGDVDFRTISLDQAQQLYESGTRYLEKVRLKKQRVK